MRAAFSIIELLSIKIPLGLLDSLLLSARFFLFGGYTIVSQSWGVVLAELQARFLVTLLVWRAVAIWSQESVSRL